MKTTIEGVAITPAIIAILGEWYKNPEDISQKCMFDGLRWYKIA